MPAELNVRGEGAAAAGGDAAREGEVAGVGGVLVEEADGALLRVDRNQRPACGREARQQDQQLAAESERRLSRA